MLDNLVRALVLDRLESAHGVLLGSVEPEVRDLWIREVIAAVVVGLDRNPVPSGLAAGPAGGGQ